MFLKRILLYVMCLHTWHDVNDKQRDNKQDGIHLKFCY